MGPSIWQLIIVLVIIVLIFGTKKLKNMGSDLGGAMKSFKKAINEKEQTDNIEESPEGRIIEGSAEHEHEETKVSEKEKS
ncbi:MAG: twin-arginine translocase TatA/TatE family subunit [Gammaproteobacteria bacterium]|nr:twin-arginine translocase TatA/TatE family subunit [Gammaproteobacteria bacterium]